MKTITRIAATCATAGLLAVGGASAASAAPSDSALGSSAVTCFGKANKPFIIGGVGTVSKQVGVIYCNGGGAYIRGSVTIQQLVGGYWYNRGAATTKTKFVGGGNVQFPDLHPAQPVAVALGGDPAYAYSATAPLPENVDEYMLAGFLRKKKVELVKCISQPDIEVPADADFIIEGYVDPNDELIWEGPFGDHTGYYSLPDWYPRFHITAITHKKNAVYPATIVGIPPQEDAWLGKATERIFLAPIKMTMVPEILDMDMPIEGVFHNLVITKIKKDYAGGCWREGGV